MSKALDFTGRRAVVTLAALTALVPLMGLTAAQAAPRDEVVAGMMRCAVITDDRQWLDCYYGAAQPMRAHLGLPPAPQFQQQILQRYYSPAPVGAAGDVPALAPLPGEQQMASRAPVHNGPPPMPQERGLLSDFFGGDNLVTRTPLRSYKINPNGAFVVTLADGQVWQQTTDDSGRHPAHWTGPASAMRVTISQGALRSYNMTVNDNESVVYKVHRMH
jgi:hypothetical protein